jgi:hypothetical protein
MFATDAAGRSTVVDSHPCGGAASNSKHVALRCLSSDAWPPQLLLVYLLGQRFAAHELKQPRQGAKREGLVVDGRAVDARDSATIVRAAELRASTDHYLREFLYMALPPW